MSGLLHGMVAAMGLAHAGTSIPIIPRESWGAKPPQGTCQPHEIANITVHHTDWDYTRVHHTPKRLRTRQKTHQRTRRWNDLAYHFVIDMDGNVYEGRNPACIGDTATEYDPTHHLLIVLDGDFEDQQPTLAAFERLTEMVAWAAQTWDVPPERIRGHRELADTPCPGDLLFAWIEDKTLHNRALALDPPQIRPLTPDQGDQRVESLKR